MEKHWWYEKNEQQRGPVTQQDLIKLLGQDYLTDENFVWQHGMRKWVKMGEIKNRMLHEQHLEDRTQKGKRKWISVLLLLVLLVVLSYIIIFM